MRRSAGKSIGYALIGISSLIMIVPFLSALMNSLKTYREYTTVPPRWIPEVFQWSNYAQVFQLGNIGGYAKQHLRGRIVRHRRTNLLLNGRLCVRAFR